MAQFIGSVEGKNIDFSTSVHNKNPQEGLGRKAKHESYQPSRVFLDCKMSLSWFTPLVILCFINSINSNKPGD